MKLMQMTTEESTIVRKTKELCQAMLEEPEFVEIRQRLDSFIANDEAKSQYQNLSEKGEYLQHKQQQGVELTPEEISEYETQREAFMKNPIARGFLAAQEEMNKVQQSVSEYVSKTGLRMPPLGDCPPITN
jgi:cell fate (sporulation/competence/biofilm development) regulator YlbF (YheA/YmcA/DUF963 family)